VIVLEGGEGGGREGWWKRVKDIWELLTASNATFNDISAFFAIHHILGSSAHDLRLGSGQQ
jgi:hypothetical protein